MDSASASVIAAAGAVGAFEAVAWGVDLQPYTSHSPMPAYVRALLVSLNAAPHLALAVCGCPPVGLAAYLPYAAFFTSAQASNWWWPYLVGLRGPSSDTLIAHVAGSAKLLPPLRGRPAPSAEHTLLFPLSLASLTLGVRAWLRLPAATRASAGNSPAALGAAGLTAAAAAAGVVRELVVLLKRLRAATTEAAAEGGGRNDEKPMAVAANDPLPFVHAAIVGSVLWWLRASTSADAAAWQG
jgi:hypothetical protein